MDKICGIYMIENKINNHVYIGQAVDIYERWKEHIRYLKRQCHVNNHLQYAWDKYGADNFQFIVIEECDEFELNAREIYWIAEKNAFFDGYNQTKGGDGTRGFKHSNEARRKMSENHANVSGENNPMWGSHHSDNTKRKIVENRNTVSGEDHPNYGKHLSDETKQKLSESHKGICAGSKHPRCRAVYCPELNREFWGAAEAEQELGIDRTYIYACLSGRQKSAGKHPITGEKLHWVDASKALTIQN